MPEHGEQVIQATTRKRCYQLIIKNPAEGKPVVTYDEEVIFSVGGNVIKNPIGKLEREYDPNDVVHIYDPETLQPASIAGLGSTIPRSVIYQLLFSAYITDAKRRDEQASVTA